MDQLALAKMMMKVNELPSLPHIANKVLSLTNSPSSSSKEISSVICQDQVLASKVLKLVNSAYYGLPRRIGTISEAITILGLQTVRSLVIGTSVYKTLNSLKGNQATNPQKMWSHGIACAVAAKMLASTLKVSEAENAFMAGLLHDIGKIIFNFFIADEYIRVLELTSMSELTMFQAEEKILDTTHVVVGRLVAEKWNLPKILTETIGYHHNPLQDCLNSELVQLVHIADAIAINAGYSSTGNNEVTLEYKVLLKFDLTYAIVHEMSQKLRGKIELDLF